MPSPIEKPGTNRAFSLGLGRQAKHQNEGISMCYGTNCGREGAFGPCYHPEDCIMRAIERDAEENLAARLARDTALSREHFPCPNCLEQGERHSLTCENGLFTCPECGGECDAAELIALYEDVRAGYVSDAETVGLWIEKLDARRVA